MFVITHKNIDIYLPKDYEIFYVNALKKNFTTEKYNDAMNSDNISLKNYSYCELTAVYILKQIADKFDRIGISHYRRFFTTKISDIVFNRKASINSLNEYLKNYDIILPYCLHFRKKLFDQYSSRHYKKDLLLAKEVIAKLYPEYLEVFNKMASSHKMISWNMFYAKSELIKKYFEWLFSILFALEQNVDISNYDDFQKRIFGFLAERLFNVRIIKNNLKIKYVHVNKTDSLKIQSVFDYVKEKVVAKRYTL